MSTIFDLRKKYFAKIDSLDFDLILEAVLKKPRSFILAHPEYRITNYELRITGYIKRRIKSEPLAYILGKKEFYGLEFKVNKNVLVPRPETEQMVETALGHITSSKEPVTVIDVGTGSGCIIITIAKMNYESRIMNHEYFGIDISSKALSVARKNAKKIGVEGIKFKKGNLLEPILKNTRCRLPAANCLITANLPYLDYDWKNLLKTSEGAGLKYEPSLALYGGKDGLDLYRKLAGELRLLKASFRPITVLCEIGHLQAAGMRKIFSFARELEIKKDHNCLNRLVIVKI